jgi:hypothetical protein
LYVVWCYPFLNFKFCFLWLFFLLFSVSPFFVDIVLHHRIVRGVHLSLLKDRGVLKKMIDGRSWAEDLSHHFVFPGFVTGLEVSLELMMWGVQILCYCGPIRRVCCGLA